jgi:phage gpG-like protein
LHTAVEKAQAALADLGQITDSLKSGPAEVPVKAITNALTQVTSAFNHLLDLAHQYDDTYKLSTHVSGILTHPREEVNAALATIAAYASHAADSANAQLKGVSDGLRAKIAQTASTGLDRALPQAVKADELFHVSERAAATKALLLQTMRDLDEKFGLSVYLQNAAGRAQTLDQKITGGRLAPALTAAYDMGWAMVGSVQEKYEDKKKELSPSS